MKLENKFTLLIIFLISGTILIISFFSYEMIKGRIEEDTGARLLDTGRVVSSVPLVQIKNKSFIYCSYGYGWYKIFTSYTCKYRT